MGSKFGPRRTALSAAIIAVNRGRWAEGASGLWLSSLTTPVTPPDLTGPIGSDPPTAYDKTFTGLTLSAPETLLLSSPTVPTGYDDMLAEAPTWASGVAFSLHPLDYLSFPVTTNVAFTVPVPFGVCTDVDFVRIMQGSTELPTTVEVLGYWQDGASQTIPRGAYIRSVLVRMNTTFSTSAAKSLTVDFSYPRTQEANLTFALSTVRHTIDTSSFSPSEYAAGEAIWEPNAVATFSAEWLCSCQLRQRMAPIDTSDAQWENYEGAIQVGSYTYPTNGGGTYAGDSEALSRIEQFAKTAVNDLRPHVTAANYVAYEAFGEYEPWLYDRASTLWMVYFKTGKLKWWRHAHRASQFYSQHLRVDGSFDLRAYDIKYSYGRCMLIDLLMTGDETLLDDIETATTPYLTDNGWYRDEYVYQEYTGSESIFAYTERQQGGALLNMLDAWEATGNSTYLTRAQEIFASAFDLQQNPGTYKAGWVKDGGMPHSVIAHSGGLGGGTGNDPCTSPWMLGIMLDATLRYYLLTEDPDALTFMADAGDYYANVSIRQGTEGQLNGEWVPWYLASDADGVGYTFSEDGESTDMEHVPDVLGAMVKCLWAKSMKGEDYTALNTAITNLYGSLNSPDWSEYSTNGAVGKWIRVEQATIDDGKAIFRLVGAPPRKFSWWYSFSADMTYLEKVVNG